MAYKQADERIPHDKESVLIVLKDGTTVEREALGVFRVARPSEMLATVRIAREGISVLSEADDWPYTTRDEKSAISVKGEIGPVFDLDTLKLKMFKMPFMEYRAYLERKEILVEDYIESHGKKYFNALVFKPEVAKKGLLELLDVPFVRADWEKIKAMKKIE